MNLEKFHFGVRKGESLFYKDSLQLRDRDFDLDLTVTRATVTVNEVETGIAIELRMSTVVGTVERVVHALQFDVLLTTTHLLGEVFDGLRGADLKVDIVRNRETDRETKKHRNRETVFSSQLFTLQPLRQGEKT